MAQKKTRFKEELRIIPSWAGVLAAILALGVPAVVITFFALSFRDHSPPFVFYFLWPLGGIMFPLLVLLIGYVNGDAKRRDMNSVLWTFLVILVPNAMGFVIYFLLRQPMPLLCPECASHVKAGSSYCSRCNFQLNPVCPNCRQKAGLEDTFCPHCGYRLAHPAPEPG